MAVGHADASRDLAEQGALSDAGPGEQAHALPLADGEQPVEHAHARGDRSIHGAAPHRGRRRAVDRDLLAAGNWASAVERPAKPVDDAAEQRGARAHRQRRARGLDGIVGADARERAERHRDGLAAVEPDDLAHERLAAPAHAHDVADAHAGHHEAQRQPRHAEHAPRRRRGRRCGELRAQGVQVHRARVYAGRRVWSVRRWRLC